MSYSPERIRYLLQAYTAGSATEAEEQELFLWAVISEEEEGILGDHIRRLVENAPEGKYAAVDWEEIYRRIREESNLYRTQRSRIKGRSWLPAAAVLLLFVLGAATYLFFRGQLPRKVTASAATSSENDIHPGTTKAILQAGGAVVPLNREDTGFVLAGNAVHIKNGELQISDGKAVQYTIITPRGGEYSLRLADGTMVWLNADSRLSYPSAFTGDDREVSLEGEAYFDVQQDADRPFTVRTGEQRIRVLGTAFNVHAYADEPGTVTTLVSGRVKVSASSGTVMLEPGQQAQLDKEGQLRLRREPDVAGAVAWREGYFRFKKADIQTIMQQLSRWYDVKVNYAPGLQRRYFGAIISRSHNISKILSMLEATGDVHFRITGKEITVMP